MTPEDNIFEAVEESIKAGWSPEKFVNEAKDAWSEALDRIKQQAHDDFTKMQGTQT